MTRVSSSDDSQTGSDHSNAENSKPSGSLPAAGVVQVETPKAALAEDAEPTLPARLRTLLVGKPRDLKDQRLFTHVSLIAFLAWVGLGADGLSSSCYGPSEAFGHLAGHEYLAVFLALATIATVFIISTCYSHIIEEFPTGGGGYLVASKLLGPKIGVISGCALLVDYVLTVTTSIAAAGNAIFGLMPDAHIPGLTFEQTKLLSQTGAIVLLIVLNLRGVRESVTLLLPIFLLFLVTHALLIAGAIGLHLTGIGEVAGSIAAEARSDFVNPEIGLLGMLALFFRAYSLGAGTYTGIEAVSNSMPVMREPKVQTAKRTMRYMAWSLAITAGGLMVAYLLLDIRLQEGTNKTMNQVLAETLLEEVGVTGAVAGGLVLLAMVSAGALLFVAAQAGFIDGPRVLANMAQDSYAPHRFASLSERLASHNGVLLMGLAALAALWYTHGDVSTLLVMYSINVFITFTLSMIGMCRHWRSLRYEHPLANRRLALFMLGAILCAGILGVTIYEKFEIGGWVTLSVTSLCVAACLLIRGYYNRVVDRVRTLNESLTQISANSQPTRSEPDPNQPTAVILVGGYSGLGVHTLLNAFRFAPDYFKNVVFVSVGVVDSGNFKGAAAVHDLEQHTRDSLEKYVDFARRMGLPAAAFMAIGTDAVDELERLCKHTVRLYLKATFFAGQLIFQRDTWYQRLLHNQTAFALQRRLQWDGLTMVILPTRVRDPMRVRFN